MGEITRYIKSQKGIAELKEVVKQHFLQKVGGEITEEGESCFIILNGKGGLNHPDYINLTCGFEISTLANVGLNRYEIKCNVHKKPSGTFWTYFALGSVLYPILWPMLGIQYWNIDPETFYTGILDECMKKIKMME